MRDRQPAKHVTHLYTQPVVSRSRRRVPRRLGRQLRVAGARLGGYRNVEVVFDAFILELDVLDGDSIWARVQVRQRVVFRHPAAEELARSGPVRCLDEERRSPVHPPARGRGPYGRADSGALPRPSRWQAAPEGEWAAVHAAVLARHDSLAQIGGRGAAEARNRSLITGPRLGSPPPAKRAKFGHCWSRGPWSRRCWT